MEEPIRVIGSGLAGSQAALAIADAGHDVDLYEMRPLVQTPAHRTAHAAELVCSNSLRSSESDSAPGLLKDELRLLGCHLLKIAEGAAVPGGTSLTVDREQFSQDVTRALHDHPRIRLQPREVAQVPRDSVCVIATGPLTSDSLARSLQELTGVENLAFHDAIAPVIDADTVDRGRAYPASRFGKGGDNDFLNCPMDQDEYRRFREALLSAEGIFQHEFDELNFFGCPPIEQLARSGEDTLRYGPMKPVGLREPRTGRPPYAVVQLRQENLRSDSFNMVGFQNQLKFGEQQRVFRMIPGLKNAEFLRYGQMHRNTYVRAPELLDQALSLREHPDVLLAGQLGGVEGYVEAMATGLIAGLNAVRRRQGLPSFIAPRCTAIGSVCHYLANADRDVFAPVRFTFDLLPPLEGPIVRDRRQRRAKQCARALASMNAALRARQFAATVQ